MVSTEPINLREWKSLNSSKQTGHLFTCGRPGRATFGTKKVAVGEDIIDLWASGLPKADVVHIVSLLGRKRPRPGRKTPGFSEFIYYPFRSSKESGSRPTFAEWLNNRYHERFVVHEFPTVDARGIPGDLLDGVTRRLLSLLEVGHTIIVLDSAGAERTNRVCTEIGYRPIT
jgi:hypothetical protein